MKQANFKKTFTVEQKYVPGSYEHYVYLTSKLIKRSYIATAKIVENWPLSKIIQRYELCTKHHTGTMPADVKWWWLRKQDGLATPPALCENAGPSVSAKSVPRVHEKARKAKDAQVAQLVEHATENH